MSRFSFAESRGILERTPAVLRDLVGGLPERLLHVDEGPGTWSAWQVLCHLAHGEMDDWVPRLRRILESGPSVPFEPFDRERGFTIFAGWTSDEILDEIALLRRDSLHAVDALEIGAEHLALEGTHPTFGRVTLEQLLACWVTHDLAHVCQISRVLVREHGRHVGPWTEFFSLLRDGSPR